MAAAGEQARADEAATQAVTGVYRAGLDALVEKFGRVE